MKKHFLKPQTKQRIIDILYLLSYVIVLSYTVTVSVISFAPIPFRIFFIVVSLLIVLIAVRKIKQMIKQHNRKKEIADDTKDKGAT